MHVVWFVFPAPTHRVYNNLCTNQWRCHRFLAPVQFAIYAPISAVNTSLVQDHFAIFAPINGCVYLYFFAPIKM